MKLKNLNKPFRNNPNFKIGVKSNSEKFENSLNQKDSLPKDSFAPENIEIGKYRLFYGLLVAIPFILIGGGFLYVYKFVMINKLVHYSLFTLLVVAIIFLLKRFDFFFRDKKPILKLSKDGLFLNIKNNPTVIEWSKITKTHISLGGPDSPNTLFVFTPYRNHKIHLDGVNIQAKELEYLLQVFRNRHTKKRVILSMDFENRYFKLKMNQRKNYYL